jgi:hypothetical protein
VRHGLGPAEIGERNNILVSDDVLSRAHRFERCPGQFPGKVAEWSLGLLFARNPQALASGAWRRSSKKRYVDILIETCPAVTQ